MKDDQLDKLSKLVPLWRTCAEMGGTPPLERVQQAVELELKAVLDEIFKDLVEERPLRQKTPHEIRTSGNSLPTYLPLPEGVDEQGRPLPVPEEELTEQQKADRAADEEAKANDIREAERLEKAAKEPAKAPTVETDEQKRAKAAAAAREEHDRDERMRASRARALGNPVEVPNPERRM